MSKKIDKLSLFEQKKLDKLSLFKQKKLNKLSLYEQKNSTNCLTEMNKTFFLQNKNERK